jgi:hypothetical protein
MSSTPDALPSRKRPHTSAGDQGLKWLKDFSFFKPVQGGKHETIPGGKCRKCRSTRVHRSRTQGALDQLIRTFTPLRAFRCGACRWRGWAVPVASQGPLLELPPLPEKRRRKGARRNSAGRKIHSPGQLAKKRARRHVALAFILALASGSALLYCQQESETGAQPP